MSSPLSSTRYAWQLLRAGPLWLDGGGMFGVVPRVVWGKSVPSDERGRIELAHNCLLLTRQDQPATKILIELGSGDKFDAKGRDIFGLTERTVVDALADVGTTPEQISQIIVSHLHFDHAGGMTRRARDGEAPDWTSGKPGESVKFTFPGAPVYVQRREWEDAIANNSVMTRTYLRENLEPMRDRVQLLDAPPPFPRGHVPRRDEWPKAPVADRVAEVVPGVFVLVVPGHTWGQQAILFADDRDRTIVFTPDVMPSVHHVGAAYNMAYDVEPFMSTISRRWFLDAAVKNDWTLVIDHEPGNPVQRVQSDGKGWYRLLPVSPDETGA